MQYEISNFAVPGEECRHNVNCWKREDYLGFGCAAASLWQNDRRTNPQTLDAYLGGEAGETEHIGPDEMLFEAVMLGMRLTQGIALAEFKQRYGVDLMTRYGAALAPAIADGRALLTRSHLLLSQRGMDVMNTVLEPLLE